MRFVGDAMVEYQMWKTLRKLKLETQMMVYMMDRDTEEELEYVRVITLKGRPPKVLTDRFRNMPVSDCTVMPVEVTV